MILFADHFDCMVSARLAALREMRGLTQAELAKRCGLKPAAVSHFETARRRPCLRNLLKLCEGLRCSPNDILLHNESSDGAAGCGPNSP
jgi:hypothetical protein